MPAEVETLRIAPCLPGMLLIAASCGTNEEEDPFLGKWHSKDGPEVLEFSRDGRMTVHREEGAQGGKFRWLDETKIELTPEGTAGPGTPYAVALAGGTLVLKDEKGAVLKYRRAARKRPWWEGSGPRNEKAGDLIREITSRASNSFDQGRLDEALADYTMALRLVEDDDAFKANVAELQAALRETRERQKAAAAAAAEFEEFKRRCDSLSSPPKALLDEGHRLLARHATQPFPWLKDLVRTTDRLAGTVALEGAASGATSFLKKQDEINESCSLRDRTGKARWGRALDLWKGYLSQERDADCRRWAQYEIRRIDDITLGEFYDLRLAAAPMAKKGRTSEAAALLNVHRIRLRGTAGGDALDRLIREIRGE